MPDLTGTDIALNYRKHVIAQSGVGRELIVKIVSDNDITDAELQAMIDYATLSHGTDSLCFGANKNKATLFHSLCKISIFG